MYLENMLFIYVRTFAEGIYFYIWIVYGNPTYPCIICLTDFLTVIFFYNFRHTVYISKNVWESDNECV